MFQDYGEYSNEDEYEDYEESYEVEYIDDTVDAHEEQTSSKYEQEYTAPVSKSILDAIKNYILKLMNT